MKRTSLVLAVALLAIGCTSRDVGPYAPDAQDKVAQQAAARNAFCAIENQARCDHLIENRTLFTRFFSQENLGGLDESKKFRGRSVTTNFVVEAVASIRQCNRVTDESIVIFKNMDLAGSKYEVRGTSPLAQQSSACFIAPQPEES